MFPINSNYFSEHHWSVGLCNDDALWNLNISIIAFRWISGYLSPIATGGGLGDQFRFAAGARDFPPLRSIQTGAHPASYTMLTGRGPRGVKWSGPEGDSLPPYSAEIKKSEGHGVVPKYRGSFTITFLALSYY
jgi:hypothetical protein